MLEMLKNELSYTYTQNGAIALNSTGGNCMDLFFSAGAMRGASKEEISALTIHAFAEDPDKTMKILFFARDVRGGLGERRFFRIAMGALAGYAPESVRKNIKNFAEYGRFDDLMVLLGTPLENEAVSQIKAQFSADMKAMADGKRVSLLAKWMPSVNASSSATRIRGKRLAALMGMREPAYRKALSALRKYTDILENRLRERDYTFDYEVQPSRAMFKYRNAFYRNDGLRYSQYLDKVEVGRAVMNTGTLYPYDIVRRALTYGISAEEIRSLDVAWKALPDLTGSRKENAIAVIDGSGSMTIGCGSLRPLDAALSLGMYFAEHNVGAFANHFITFSETPQLVEIKGGDIVEKAQYCASYNEIANTDLEQVFLLILRTALNNRVPQKELPTRLYIISDMEFDEAVTGGNSKPLFREMKELFAQHGYKLPEIVFWNVSARMGAIPVGRSETGAALVSGYTPAVFDMVMSGELSPETVMEQVLSSPRYAKISA